MASIKRIFLSKAPRFAAFSVRIALSCFQGIPASFGGCINNLNQFFGLLAFVIFIKFLIRFNSNYSMTFSPERVSIVHVFLDNPMISGRWSQTSLLNDVCFIVYLPCRGGRPFFNGTMFVHFSFSLK